MEEQTIFSEALQQKTPAERNAFLDQACGTAGELRQSLDLLLKAHDKAADFLEEPAGAAAVTIDRSPLAQPGTQIGPYKLLEQIGEGGMGVVYVASQREPIRRTVALKIIKPGMDTREAAVHVRTRKRG